jgi:DNA-binding CsgD family transcriptional regulator
MDPDCRRHWDRESSVTNTKLFRIASNRFCRWHCPNVSAKLADVFNAQVEAPMESHPLVSLTPSERNVLRVLLRERDQKAIARQLNLSPETVKTHLRNAREKTGVRTSFALARALAEHESHPPERGITLSEGGPAPTRSTKNEPSKRPEESDLNDDAFHERRAVFDYGQSSFTAPAPWEEKKRNSLPASMRMLIVTGMGFLLVVLIILAFPLSESFQRFANVLDPPKH